MWWLREYELSTELVFFKLENRIAGDLCTQSTLSLCQCITELTTQRHVASGTLSCPAYALAHAPDASTPRHWQQITVSDEYCEISQLSQSSRSNSPAVGSIYSESIGIWSGSTVFHKSIDFGVWRDRRGSKTDSTASAGRKFKLVV